MTVCPHCYTDSATLRAQAEMIEALEQELSEVRSNRVIVAPIPEHARDLVLPGGASKLTRPQARMLSLLLTQERVTWESLYAVSGSQALKAADLVKVQICHLRQKIAPLGLTIQTIWGWGYQIPREQVAEAKEKLAA